MLPVFNIELEKLSIKYAKKIPRYTSYPTALELKTDFDRLKLNNLISKTAKRISSYSFYLHLPYCPSLCYFCACNKIISRDKNLNDEYLKLLGRELALLSGNLDSDAEAVQIHLGGGSPSHLTPVQMEGLERILRSSLKIPASCDRSIEIDPRTYSHDLGTMLGMLSYQRASLGVQDFDELVQKFVNRKQSFDLVAGTCESLRDVGFKEINFDLIYGLPGQTVAGVRETIKQAIKLKPDRIALYGYAHVNWKVKAQNVFNKLKLPQPLERLRMFIESVELLTEAGYQYIGLDHFALPQDSLNKARNEGRLRRNFMGYTPSAGDAVIAAGVSAISDLDECLYQNHTGIDGYQGLLDKSLLPVHKALERNLFDRIRAWMIERLMCDRQLSLNALLTKFSFCLELIPEIFESGQILLKPLQDDGLVELSDDLICVTEMGAYFLRNIASVFDAYLEENNDIGAATQYSQSL